MKSLISLLVAFFKRVSGTSGCRHLNSSDGTFKGKVHTIIIQEDSTAFTTALGSDGQDYTGTADGMWNVSGKTLNKGALLTVPLGVHLSSIRFSAGSGLLYLE